MFSISDSNYRHQDEVEFTIADLALTRFTDADWSSSRNRPPFSPMLWPVRFRERLQKIERADHCELRRDGKTISSRNHCGSGAAAWMKEAAGAANFGEARPAQITTVRLVSRRGRRGEATIIKKRLKYRWTQWHR